MSDGTPRQMPIEVTGAYGSVRLLPLLVSSLYRSYDHRDVMEKLTRSLISKHGEVWIDYRGEEAPVSALVDLFAMNPRSAVEVLRSVEEYGCREGVDAELAVAMQPRFSSWWARFRWRDRDDVRSWCEIVSLVLGPRQSAWLAAQYARTAVPFARPEDRRVCLDAIEAVEAWAKAPTESNLLAGRSARERVHVLFVASAYEDSAVGASSSAANVFTGQNQGGVAHDACFAAWDAAEAASFSGSLTEEDAFGRLESLTKRLITPSLVISASGEARASGSARSMVAPSVIGAVIGAGAVFVSRRR